MSMQASEKLFLQTVGRFVGDRFKLWVAPIVGRIETLELALSVPAVEFTEPQKEYLRSIVNTCVQQAVLAEKFATVADINEAIAKIPAGPPGASGKDGKDGADVNLDFVKGE